VEQKDLAIADSIQTKCHKPQPIERNRQRQQVSRLIVAILLFPPISSNLNRTCLPVEN
jgi:hypothetical protein